MGVGQGNTGHLGGLLICTLGFLGGLVLLVTACEFSNISVVVSLHFVEKDFTFVSGAVWNQILL